jgi:hypothetical protein
MDEKRDKNIKFISFYNDKNRLVEGYFEVLEENTSFIKFKTNRNILTLPWNKINKTKAKIEVENEKKE